MKNFIVKPPTKTTPYIKLDSDSGIIEFKGKMIPENSARLFDPLIKWIDQYVQHTTLKTQLNIQLDYFNTSSSKFLLEVFRKMETLYKRHNEITINWICEKNDFDMIEAGEDYQSIVNIPINIIESDLPLS